jgi:hypothetical protein
MVTENWRIRFLLAALLALPGILAAQERVRDHNLHGWFMYFGDHPLGGSRWGVHVEGQFRRHDVIAKWQQFLVRPGINYQAAKSVMLTAGYAYARSNVYSEYAAPAPVSHEHRIWEQASIRYRTGKLAWSTRLRFENRFVGTDSGYRYENRFRAMQQARIPVAERRYVTAYNEFWTYVKPYVSNSAFDQNRVYAAAGFELTPTLRLETGYMNQTLLVRSGTRLEFNHTFMVSFFSNAGWSR